MRFVLTLASLLTVTLLIFNGYANSSGRHDGDLIDGAKFDPVTQATDVSMIVENSVANQRKAFEEKVQ